MDSTETGERMPEVSWRVVWKSRVPLAETDGLPLHRIERQDYETARKLAAAQRDAGFETRLYRVEQTEVVF